MTDFNYPETVVVHSCDGYSSSFIPDNLLAAIEYLQKHADSIPAQYRGQAKLNIESYYDSPRVEMEIIYRRPPTPEEIQKRETEEKKRREAQLVYTRKNFEAAQREFLKYRDKE